MIRSLRITTTFLLLINIFNTNYILAGNNETKAEYIVMQDDLQGSTIGTMVGGAISSSSYKPGVGFNHILYNVPAQVSNGYVEFQMKGFNPSLLPTGSDNGFIGMYDGRGISEPIGYFDDFKENYFRWNFHWRESANVFKTLVSCAEPTSARLNSSLAVFTSARDWTHELNGSSFSWNSSTWYTVKLEWNNKTFKVYVNGSVVVNLGTGSYDYVPIDFKIWLGCAPGYENSSKIKYKNMVPNLEFRNFKVVSYDPIVPVELTTFTASKIENRVNLNWSTATETNNLGFEIERKIVDNWTSIAQISGKGTTSEISNYSYTDNLDQSINGKIYYRLKQIDFDGTTSYSQEIELDINNTPESYSLDQNYPNPFNPETTIKFTTPEAGHVNVSVFNSIGQNVKTLLNKIVSAGNHKLRFNANGLPSGIYYYRINSNNFTSTRKMIFLK